VSAAQIREELEKRAAALGARLEAAIEKVMSTNPNVARILQVEERELKVLVGELAFARLSLVVAALERRLSETERRVEEQLRRIEGETVPSKKSSIPPTKPKTPLRHQR
jgi:hypothetical protein